MPNVKLADMFLWFHTNFLKIYNLSAFLGNSWHKSQLKHHIKIEQAEMYLVAWSYRVRCTFSHWNQWSSAWRTRIYKSSFAFSSFCCNVWNGSPGTHPKLLSGTPIFQRNLKKRKRKLINFCFCFCITFDVALHSPCGGEGVIALILRA